MRYLLWQGKWPSIIYILGIILVVIAILIYYLGYLLEFGVPLTDFYSVFKKVYANISLELVSISFTVLILDTLYRRRENKLLKEQLIRQLHSSDNNLVLQALRELRSLGWLEDGSLNGRWLNGVSFQRAPLENAELNRVKLEGSNLSRANLTRASLFQGVLTDINLRSAIMVFTDLEKAILIRANLEKANLSGAILKGVNFDGATLREADLTNAIFDPKTIFPNGENWLPGLDVSKYTN